MLMTNGKYQITKVMMLLLLCTITVGVSAQEKTHFVKNADAYINVDMGFWSPYSMETYEDGLSTTTSMFSASFEGELTYRKASKSSDALCYAIGFSGSVFKSEYVNPCYDFSSTADVDGDEYIREYRNLYLNQRASTRSFSMALSARHKIHLSKRFDLYGDLGLKVDLFARGSLDRSEGSADVYGLYRQYDNLDLGGEWNSNGFGHVDFKTADRVRPGVNKCVPMAFARLGFMWQFTDRCSMGVGAIYNYAFCSSLKYSDNGKYSEYDAIVHNTIDDEKRSAEHVKSVLGMYHRSRLNCLGLNVSLRYYIFSNED